MDNKPPTWMPPNMAAVRLSYFRRETAKMSTQLSQSITIGTCCDNPSCRTYQNIVMFLKIWGFTQQPRAEVSRHCFVLEIPDYWAKNRVNTFKMALKELPKGHS